MTPHIPRRIKAAWNVLRGRPTAYRAKITGGSIHLDPTTVAYECVFLPEPYNARQARLLEQEITRSGFFQVTPGQVKAAKSRWEQETK